MILFKPPQYRHAFRRTRRLKILARVRHADPSNHHLRRAIRSAKTPFAVLLDFDVIGADASRGDATLIGKQRTGRFLLCPHVARTIGISTE